MSRAATQEAQIALWDLPAIDIVMALHVEQFELDRAQTRIGHPVPKEAPDDGQQVEVSLEVGRGPTRHPIAGLE